jgi:hypothetical protein
MKYLSLTNTSGVAVYPLKRDIVSRFDNKIREKPPGEITCLMRKSMSLVREQAMNVHMKS